MSSHSYSCQGLHAVPVDAVLLHNVFLVGPSAIAAVGVVLTAMSMLVMRRLSPQSKDAQALSRPECCFVFVVLLLLSLLLPVLPLLLLSLMLRGVVADHCCRY